jgi:thiol-disulfide isomerase/thioredoxin
METEKLLLVVVLSAIIGVGMLFGFILLGYQPDSNGNDSSDNTPTITAPAGIEDDTDLLELGLEAPDWELLMSNEETITLHSLRGEFIVIDLMATWCTSCASQNTELKQIQEDYSDSVRIISLTVDLSESAALMAEYKENHDLPWDHGVDSNGVFASYFNVAYIPTIVLVDENGYFRWVHTGYWPSEDISDTLNELLT